MCRRGVTPRLAISEKELQAHVRSFAEMCGYCVYHTFDSRHSPAGFPDLTLWRETADGKGELVFVELKSEKGRVTLAQQIWLVRLGTVPGVRWAGVIRPSDWFAGKLDSVLRCRDA